MSMCVTKQTKQKRKEESFSREIQRERQPDRLGMQIQRSGLSEKIKPVLPLKVRKQRKTMNYFDMSRWRHITNCEFPSN